MLSPFHAKDNKIIVQIQSIFKFWRIVQAEYDHKIDCFSEIKLVDTGNSVDNSI